MPTMCKMTSGLRLQADTREQSRQWARVPVILGARVEPKSPAGSDDPESGRPGSCVLEDSQEGGDVEQDPMEGDRKVASQ